MKKSITVISISVIFIILATKVFFHRCYSIVYQMNSKFIFPSLYSTIIVIITHFLSTSYDPMINYWENVVEVITIICD